MSTATRLAGKLRKHVESTMSSAGDGSSDNSKPVSIKEEESCSYTDSVSETPKRMKKSIKQETLTDTFPVRKKRDRFNGLTEDEVLTKTLPDHLTMDLDIIIIGINPGLTAAHVGHHYAGPGNHFWKCLYMSGLTPEQMNAYDDFRLKEFGIGFTNIVSRTSRSSADLTRTEIKEGALSLAEKIQKYRPKIAAFNGKGIYEVFCGNKNFHIGKQPEPFPGTDTVIFVMPSSSARCSQLPRAVDKLPFYVALRKLRDHLRGQLPNLDESQVIFLDLELKIEPREYGEGEVKNEPVVAKGRRRKKDVDSTSIESKEHVDGEVAKNKPKVARGRRQKKVVDSSKESTAEVPIQVEVDPFDRVVDSQPSACQGLPSLNWFPNNSNFSYLFPFSSSSYTPGAGNMIPTALKEEGPCDLSCYGYMPLAGGSMVDQSANNSSNSHS